MTKSVTSLLVGIALDMGKLASLDERAARFFPEHAALTARDGRMGRSTLAHLLTLSAGLECDDWNPGSAGKEEKMYRSDDWLRFVLSLAMVSKPGGVARVTARAE